MKTSKAKSPKTVTFRLTLDVTYKLNGECPADMRQMLEQIVKNAAGEGQMTGETAAEVNGYDYLVEKVDSVPVSYVEINDVLAQVTQAFRSLAWQAGDVEEWNEGGEAYKASQAVRALRARLG